MRVTYHNGRANKSGGVYSAKHNDRQFDLDNADHIDPERQDQNFYWHCYQKKNLNLTFEQAEKKFYEEHFSEFLTDRNEKYLQQRHKDKVQTIDDYLKSRKSCPEEIIFAIGNVKDFQNLDAEKIAKVYNEFRHWRKEKYPNVVSLDVALHADEAGVPHTQERVAWIAHDKNGNEMVSQGQALKEMGVPLPFPEKKESRYNNAKITFTHDCREKFFEICKSYGIEIEEKPKERSEVGLTLTEYKTRQEEIKIENLKIENQRLKSENKNLKTENEEMKKSNVMLRVMRDDYAREGEKKYNEVIKLDKELQHLKIETQKGKNELKILQNDVENERKNLRFVKNLVRICDNNEKKLKILIDVIKENDKGAVLQPKLDLNGNYLRNDKGQPMFEKIGGVFGDLSTVQLAGLVIPPEKDRDWDDWDLLSEAEKADREAHQAMDRY